jgi:hypothetical protein
MKKIFILILFLFPIISCTQKGNKKVESTDVTSSTQNEIVNANPKNEEPEQYIENQDLLTQLEAELNTFRSNQKLTISKELINNRHVENQIDTIVTYTDDKMTIKTYKISKDQEWISEAKLLNSELAFSKLVNIGMEGKALEKVANTKIKSDVVKIGNLEQTSAFIFKFKDDKVYEINYEGYVD